MRYSKGICWVDDTRIPFVDEGDIKSQARAFTEGSSSHKGQAWNNHLGWEGSKGEANPTNTQGRFTPSLLVCDDMLNDGSVSKSQKTNGVNIGRFPNTIKTGVEYQKEYERGFDDKGTNSRYYDLDKWFDKIIKEL